MAIFSPVSKYTIWGYKTTNSFNSLIRGVVFRIPIPNQNCWVIFRRDFPTTTIFLECSFKVLSTHDHFASPQTIHKPYQRMKIMNFSSRLHIGLKSSPSQVGRWVSLASGLEIFFQDGYLKEIIQRYENTSPPCPEINECPLQRDHFEKKIIFPTINFRGICWFSAGVPCHRAFLSQESLYCQPQQRTIKGKPPRITIHLCCLIPPKRRNLMTSTWWIHTIAKKNEIILPKWARLPDTT